MSVMKRKNKILTPALLLFPEEGAKQQILEVAQASTWATIATPIDP